MIGMCKVYMFFIRVFTYNRLTTSDAHCCNNIIQWFTTTKS